MLVENTLFGIRNKVEESIDFLRLHVPPEGYYVAFSGGKDSIVTLDLVRRSGVKHDVHMNLTSVDPPELLKFVREHYAGIDFVKPKISMHGLIVKKGMLPTRIIRFCCQYLKETSGNGRMMVTGVRREESSARSVRQPIEQDLRKKNKIHVRPVLTWTESDIWEYIEENKLPYPSLYDEGYSRIGCIMCPMRGKVGMIRDKERWPAIYRMYEGACEKAIQRLRNEGKTVRHETAKDMMHWWIYSQKG